jgi:hypothetical protein
LIYQWISKAANFANLLGQFKERKIVDKSLLHRNTSLAEIKYFKGFLDKEKKRLPIFETYDYAVRITRLFG